jgi:hypothetical protein
VTRPTSFRLPDDLLERLDDESRAHDESISALVLRLLDEGLKARRFPGIVFRDGPAGRRAALLGGPDVWEVVRDLRHAPGRGAQRVAALAEEIGLPPARIRLAADFYAAHPDEVDRLIALDEAASRRAQQPIERREQLLS